MEDGYTAGMKMVNDLINKNYIALAADALNLWPILKRGEKDCFTFNNPDIETPQPKQIISFVEKLL